MDATKRFYQNLSNILIFSYLSVFPLGQLLKISFPLWGLPHFINISDIIVLLFIPIFYLGKFEKPAIFKSISDFVFVCLFSLILSLNYFTLWQVSSGSLYLIRFTSYLYFFMVSWNLIRRKALSRSLILNSLLLVSIFTAVLGWIQYFWMPDLTFLRAANWDDHLYRLVGTFLDPSFTAIIIVFGTLITLVQKSKSNIQKLLISSFLIISLMFTYSRASYIALLAGIVTLFLKKYIRNLKIPGLILLAVVLAILVLPRRMSEGTELTRTRSIYAKIDNYKETYQIIGKYPIFGVGFNNLCFERLNGFDGNSLSHACSGSDSSLLFVLATSGLVGFLIFLNMVYRIFTALSKDIYGIVFMSCSGALFIDSLFVQSAFYPFVMGFMGLLFAISLSSKE